MPCTVIQMNNFAANNPLEHYSRIEMTGIYNTLENTAVLSKMLDVLCLLISSLKSWFQHTGLKMTLTEVTIKHPDFLHPVRVGRASHGQLCLTNFYGCFCNSANTNKTPNMMLVSQSVILHDYGAVIMLNIIEPFLLFQHCVLWCRQCGSLLECFMRTAWCRLDSPCMLDGSVQPSVFLAARWWFVAQGAQLRILKTTTTTQSTVGLLALALL